MRTSGPARNRPRRRSGAATVEMAAVLPVFCLTLFGMLESARWGAMSQRLQNAAREGCRVAAQKGATQATVQARVGAVLSGSGLSPGAVSPSPSNWTTAAGGTAITVTLSVPFSQVAWLGSSTWFKGGTLRASATFCSER